CMRHVHHHRRIALLRSMRNLPKGGPRPAWDLFICGKLKNVRGDSKTMFRFKLAATAAFMAAILVVGASAQSTTGTVSMSATVSKFVEINSGGPVTLTGNSGGGVTTDGTLN